VICWVRCSALVRDRPVAGVVVNLGKLRIGRTLKFHPSQLEHGTNPAHD
jgi:hypothetical protein